MFKMKTFVAVALIVVVLAAFADAQQKTEDKKYNVNADVTHSKAGTNVYVDGQARLWQSQNKRHEIHGQGSYGQHFGGPYGNSRPNYGGGLVYRHRF